jgi:GTP pyrophosphokinase
MATADFPFQKPMWDPKALPEHLQYSLLARAIAFALNFHDGQVDKSGHPAIYHPLAVAYKVALAGGDEIQQAAAVLHDVVEDCAVSLSEIFRVFGAPVACLVDALSQRGPLCDPDEPGEKYAAYIERVYADGDRAVLIKICDIEHNIDRSCEPGSTEMQRRLFSAPIKPEFAGLVKRYRAALERLRRPRE